MGTRAKAVRARDGHKAGSERPSPAMNAVSEVTLSPLPGQIILQVVVGESFPCVRQYAKGQVPAILINGAKRGLSRKHEESREVASLERVKPGAIWAIEPVV